MNRPQMVPSSVDAVLSLAENSCSCLAALPVRGGQLQLLSQAAQRATHDGGCRV